MKVTTTGVHVYWWLSDVNKTDLGLPGITFVTRNDFFEVIDRETGFPL